MNHDPYDLPTGTYDPPGNSKLVFLAGAVTFWWNDNWDTPDRRAYHAWRQQARYALIEAGYITYAPHEALKGPWNPRMQNINNLAIGLSDCFVVLSDTRIPSNGTEKEIEIADMLGVPVIWTPAYNGTEYLLDSVAEVV
jgi:hypothetical protein